MGDSYFASLQFAVLVHLHRWLLLFDLAFCFLFAPSLLPLHPSCILGALEANKDLYRPSLMLLII